MKTHLIKTDPEVFNAVLVGAKTFEIRLNDRDYQVGDTLRLMETESTGEAMRAGAPLVFSGREIVKVVSHVLSGYGLADGWVCLSFDYRQSVAESLKGLAESWRVVAVDTESQGHKMEAKALRSCAGDLEHHCRHVLKAA